MSYVVSDDTLPMRMSDDVLSSFIFRLKTLTTRIGKGRSAPCEYQGWEWSKQLTIKFETRAQQPSKKFYTFVLNMTKSGRFKGDASFSVDEVWYIQSLTTPKPVKSTKSKSVFDRPFCDCTELVEAVKGVIVLVESHRDKYAAQLTLTRQRRSKLQSSGGRRARMPSGGYRAEKIQLDREAKEEYNQVQLFDALKAKLEEGLATTKDI